MRLVKAEKASPHAKFYNLSSANNYQLKILRSKKSTQQRIRNGRKFEFSTRAWYGMENGMEILIWNMEDARMEWNGRF